jgi:formylglycine-generating enzyme required for sulfatase activity
MESVARQTPETATDTVRRPVLAMADHPLTQSRLPYWASGWGEDHYGVWLELTLGETTQRMRWIRPGRFLMGSPADEPGRSDESEFCDDYNEGPRHEVQLSRGYWLFDTPVTQALWQAVMGRNWSRFVDPKRPMEDVSWDDAASFVGRINGRFWGLDLVLPTEAQWEYACRAGTDATTYVGHIEILGQRNAPTLDAIAWYSGNSGVGFELENGQDSSRWLEKQFKHDRAGTRPVALKMPNAWGLYDMLGNVWEWCADDLRTYGSDPVIDPVGSLETNDRALRGGAWNGDARDVRAARRMEAPHVCRSVDFGFRCARARP